MNRITGLRFSTNLESLLALIICCELSSSQTANSDRSAEDSYRRHRPACFCFTQGAVVAGRRESTNERWLNVERGRPTPVQRALCSRFRTSSARELFSNVRVRLHQELPNEGSSISIPPRPVCVDHSCIKPLRGFSEEGLRRDYVGG